MTEFHQPINPMRLFANITEHQLVHYVFAIAISNAHDVEYLTADGHFFRPTQIMFTETLIDGKWCRLERCAN